MTPRSKDRPRGMVGAYATRTEGGGRSVGACPDMICDGANVGQAGGILRDAPAAPEIMFLDDAVEDADFAP